METRGYLGGNPAPGRASGRLVSFPSDRGGEPLLTSEFGRRAHRRYRFGMRIARSLGLAVLVAMSCGTLVAQGFGIRVTWPASRGVLVADVCGFNCNDPNNVAPLTVDASSTGRVGLLTIGLEGDAMQPAALAFSTGAPVACAAGLSLPGIANLLLLDPFTVLPIAVSDPGLPVILIRGTPAPGPCGGTGRASLFSLPLPAPALSGASITAQGIVRANATWTATRPLRVTFR